MMSMKKKEHINWSSVKWEEEVEYAKIILNEEERISVRMLNIRYSMEAILKYLCKDKNITYRIANDAIQDLHKQNILNIQDVQAFNNARVFSNKYCHYGKQQGLSDDIDMSEADLNLAVQAWKYIAIWIAGKYFADVDDDNKQVLLNIVQGKEIDHSSLDNITESSMHDDSVMEETTEPQPIKLEVDPAKKETDSVIQDTPVAEMQDNDCIAMPALEAIDKDISASDAPLERSTSITKKQSQPKASYKRYAVIFVTVVALLFLGRFGYMSGYFDTMNPDQMIQAETDIHDQMWILTNGINGDVRSESDINNAQHWIDESDKVLKNIDDEIRKAEDARLHNTDLKVKYIEILQHEKDSITHTRQGIVDTTQGKSYSEEFLKGTQIDIQYDQCMQNLLNPMESEIDAIYQLSYNKEEN